jgi:hypothetical protein
MSVVEEVAEIHLNFNSSDCSIFRRRISDRFCCLFGSAGTLRSSAARLASAVDRRSSTMAVAMDREMAAAT